MIPPPPGQQATAERHTALTPLPDRVFPLTECEDWRGDGWGVWGEDDIPARLISEEQR